LELNAKSYPWERTAFENDARLVKGTKILSRILAGTLDDKGIDAALEAFEKGKAGGADSYFIDENEINQLGYRSLNAGKVPEAIKIFMLNVREFPKSWNVYDSLGEAYAAHGDKELAIKNYEKSIELNSRNTNLKSQ
jgi:tetratricopeptide (TPR) repeat protein